MNKRSMAAAMAAVALLATTMVLAAEKLAAKPEEKASVVQGEVLDLACYMGHGGMGEGHAGCAAKCLKGGQPMGLLGADGSVYVLIADHSDASAFERTKEFAGKKVEISGEVATKSGLKGITVHAVKAM